MKITGIVAEFNPFHNGHKFLFEKAKENNEAIVVVMSQDLLQRGEFSSFGKWWRTEIALKNGADLVIGLPAVVSGSSAEYFAHESLRLLNTIGIDTLTFGVESIDKESVLQTAEILLEEPKSYQLALQSFLKKGYNFPKARMLALEHLWPISNEILMTPNNILGLEYTKAILKLNRKIELNPVQRIGEDYRSQTYSHLYSSATGIRKALEDKNTKNLLLPFSIQELENNYHPVDERLLLDTLKIKLISSERTELLNISETNEDILNRMFKTLENDFSSIDDYLDYLVTKNITRSRLRRVIMQIITNIRNEEKKAYAQSHPTIRLLGANSVGRKILRNIENPVISNFNRDRKKLNEEALHFLDIDIRVANIRSILTHEKEYNDDYKKKPIIL